MRRLYKRASVVVVVIALGLLWASRRMNSRASDSSRVIMDPALAAPPRVTAVVNRHCRDCHSDATRWPWYARIPPVSWLIRRDVDHARGALNFSRPLIGSNDAGAAVAVLSAICKAAKSGSMPPWRYRWLHPNSTLNADDQAQLCQWTQLETVRLERVAAADARSNEHRPNH